MSALADLALLALALGLLLGIAGVTGALAGGRRALAARIGAGVGALVALYAVALLGVAFASRERVLAIGEEKSVSGFDPHLHFHVTGPPVRDPDGGLEVTVLLRSDALRAVQDPASLAAVLVDARGRRWRPVIASTAGVDRVHGLVPFGRRLAPGESYVATLAFHPDSEATGLRLLVTEAGWPCLVVIGHERSPFHRQTYFALGPAGPGEP
jgi:hypothetical protein